VASRGQIPAREDRKARAGRQRVRLELPCEPPELRVSNVETKNSRSVKPTNSPPKDMRNQRPSGRKIAKANKGKANKIVMPKAQIEQSARVRSLLASFGKSRSSRPMSGMYGVRLRKAMEARSHPLGSSNPSSPGSCSSAWKHQLGATGVQPRGGEPGRPALDSLRRPGPAAQALRDMTEKATRRRAREVNRSGSRAVEP
jgi:hypothetical protein